MDDVQNNCQSKNSEKKCKYCKKRTLDPVICAICEACFHLSCSSRVETCIYDGKFTCCDDPKKSEVNFRRGRKNSEKSENLLNMDERKLREIIEESFRHFLKPVEKKMGDNLSDISKSIQFMSDAFEDQKESFKKILVEIQTLRKENVELRKRINTLEDRLERMEVSERANNIIISGIPKQTELSTTRITAKIFKGLKLPLTEGDVAESYRVSKNEDGPIMVKLHNLQSKRDVLKSIRLMKGLTISQCDLVGTDRKIYINEDLPYSVRDLFKKTRAIKKQKGYRAAYCVNGQIYLKITDQDPPIKIRREEDLN